MSNKVKKSLCAIAATMLVLVSVFAVYVVCTLIDFARIQFLEKPVFKMLDSKLNKNI